MDFKSNSQEETKEIARDISQHFKNKGGVIALSGELGAGKTTFVQGFAQGLGITEKVISPTFVLIRQHLIPDTQRTLYHIDLYRLEGKISSIELGLKDMIDGKNIILIEWAEKISEQLPSKTAYIKITKTSSEHSRRILMDDPGLKERVSK